jgi:hypothetical protein
MPSGSADAAARAEEKAVIECWNERLSASQDMLRSPTIRAALIAGTPCLDVFCPGCGTSLATDRGSHPPGAAVLVGPGIGAVAEDPRLYALPPAATCPCAVKSGYFAPAKGIVGVTPGRRNDCPPRQARLHNGTECH